GDFLGRPSLRRLPCRGSGDADEYRNQHQHRSGGPIVDRSVHCGPAAGPRDLPPARPVEDRPRQKGPQGIRTQGRSSPVSTAVQENRNTVRPPESSEPEKTVVRHWRTAIIFTVLALVTLLVCAISAADDTVVFRLSETRDTIRLGDVALGS